MDNKIRKCEICGSEKKVSYFRKRILLCENHYKQEERKEKRELRESIKIKNLKNEIWIDVNNYEGLYQVSNLGRIKSLPKFYQGEKIMTPRKDRYGYYYIGLIKSKVKKSYKVHRLVAIAFIDNNFNYPCVNHKDEDKLNNKVENLEWCTVEYNNKYGNRILNATSKTIGRRNTEESKKRMSLASKKRIGVKYGI